MKNKYTHTLTIMVILAISIGCSTTAVAQDKKQITGTVSDDTGPLLGASVLIKNTSQGTITDIDGAYSIHASPSDTLVFTYLGFLTEEIPVNLRKQINVHLDSDETSLDQVVINAGYYKVSERERTGNISRITAKEMENNPLSIPLAAMQGKMSGVNIIQETGVPGGGYSIEIRGRNSIRDDGSNPLYIVDGVPYPSQSLGASMVSTVMGKPSSPLNSINSEDIESIEVLKDADATAIYGSRGANGVVLITTKKGATGKTSLTINTHSGIGNLTRKMKLLSTDEYLEMRREAFKNDGIDVFPVHEYDINGKWNQSIETDWQKELLGHSAYFNSYNLSLTGGNNNANYLLSGNHQKQTTVFPGNFDYKKYSAFASLSYKSTDGKLLVSFTTNYVNDNNNLPTTAFITPALTLSPNAPSLYDNTGKVNWENGTFSNPIAQLNAEYLSSTSSLLGSSIISYDLAKNLKLKGRLGYNEMHLKETRTAPSTIYNPAFGFDSSISSVLINNSTRKSWIVEPQIEYRFTVDKLVVEPLVGITFQKEKSNYLLLDAGNFTSNSLIYDIASAAELHIMDNTEDEYTYNAAYGRVNLNWANKYILNFTGRRDGSSRFGKNNKFANFGALGVGWLFSEEESVSNLLPFLTFGKIRGSYGSSGNDQISNYGYLNSFEGNGLFYQNTPVLEPVRLYNPNFQWEINKKLELALELSLFNRLYFSVAYYRNRSSNQLVGVPLPGTTGFQSLMGNLDAVVENTGIEIELDGKIITKTDFEWNISLNHTQPRNKLVSFPDLNSSTYANQLVIGEPLSIKLLYHYTGVDPQTGYYTFEDVDGDGQITFPDDAKKVKKVGVEYFGGITNSISYKNLSLEFLLQFVKQTGYNQLYTSSLPGTAQNQPTKVLDRWQNPGDIASTQRFSAGYDDLAYEAFGNLLRSDAIISDASYIRLKNIALYYHLPYLKSLGTSCRFYIQGQNLLTFTKFRGMDPETQGLNQLPPLKILSVGLEIKI